MASSLVLTVPSGPAGAIVELQTPAGSVKSPVQSVSALGITTSDVTNVSTVAGATDTDALQTLQGLIQALTSSQVANVSSVPGATVTDALVFLLTRGGYGLQTQWAIDPATGNDSGPGTPAQPLRTMAQFNARMAYTQVTAGAVTLQLVGNVTDAPLQLVGTSFAVGSTLTVSGTVTTVGTATVSNVTTLETLAAFQLTTTGIVWTSGDVGKRLLLPGGQVGWVAEFVDANNVITGPFVSSAGAAVAPAIGNAMSVQTLSSSIAANVQGTCTTTGTVVTVQHTAIATSFAAGLFISNGIPLGMFGCSVTFTLGVTVFAQDFINFFACFYTGGTGWNFRGQGSLLGVTAVSCPSGCNGRSNLIMGPALFDAAAFVMNEGSIMRLAARLHWRNTNGPLKVFFGSVISCQNLMSGSVGNTGVGVTVGGSCAVLYPAPSVKPSVTGASDTLIGTTARTYAQIPYVDLQLNAIPPTVQTLTGTPATMAQGNP